MTKVLKLAISGIRSFGGDEGDEQTLNFQAPLTLILGQNGCGKTTIIESLKYVTTGELPKGQGKAFVHDPKMSGHSEVFGQVKLKFSDVQGKPVTVVRSLKSTQKVKELKTCAVDQTISREGPNGEIVSVSMRCADVDQEMDRSFGVSKAILENVIFCHQEDSNWPLDEAKKVKERFDAIFDATKYNKCLEHIRKLAKEKKSDLKVLEMDVSHLRNNKEEAEEKKKNLATLERQLGTSRDEIKEFNRQLGPISERLNHIHQVESKVVRLQTNLATKKIQLDGIKKQLQDLRKNISKTYPGSTEELRQAILSFKNQLFDKERCLSTLEDELSEATREEKEARNEVGSEQVKVGQLQEEEKQYKRLSKERSSKLQSLAKELSIPQSTFSSDEELPSYEVKSMLDDVERKLKSLESDFEKTRRRCKAEEERLQSQVNESRDKKVKIEQEIHMKEEQLSANKNEISKLKAELEEVQSAAGRLTKLEDDLKNAERNLNMEEENFDMEAEKLEIRSLKDKRNRLQARLEEVNKDVQSLQQRSRIQAELDIHTETKSSKESEIKRIQKKHNDTLTHLLQKVPERRFKYAVESCLEKLTDCITSMDSQLREKDKELTELDTNRKHIKEQLRRKEDTLRENEEKLYDACGGDEFDDVVKNLSKQIEELQDQKGTLSSSEYMFRRYIQKLQQQDPCCPLCHRDFANDDESQELVADLNNRVRELPHKLRENESKLKDLKEKHSTLLQLKPVHEKTSLIKNTEIPDLKKKISSIESQIKDIKQESERLQSDLKCPQIDIEMAKSCMNDMILLDQLIDELQRVNKEIDRINSKMPPGGSNRTMKEALAEQENIQLELKETQKESEKKQADLNSHSERISSLREARNNIISEKLKIQGGLQASNSVRERLKELEQLRKVIAEEITKKKSELFESNETLMRFQQEKKEALGKIQKELDDDKEKLDKVKRSVHDIRSLNKTVEEMERKGVEQNVATARTRLARLEKKADSASSKQQDIMQRIDGIRSELSMQQIKERELNDNMKLRELEGTEDVLDTEVKELQVQMGNVKFDTLREEKKKLIGEEDEITRKKAHAEGRQKEREANVFALEKELSKNFYKDAEKKYRDTLLELIVQKKACEDLLQFNTALDWAMMYFHRERMQSINAIIRELWSIVYKGNDVDTIEIRTDESGEGTGGTERRRMYNYRVVMKKKDVEMDMRGRCSAGQKMLASLIIRMALAETFSSQCGILALDEPTTNLDTDNSTSLSEALSEIVRRRSSQRNFQLIVITHDEEFVENLARGESLQSYYVVSRNSAGKSVIKLHGLD